MINLCLAILVLSLLTQSFGSKVQELPKNYTLSAKWKCKNVKTPFHSIGDEKGKTKSNVKSTPNGFSMEKRVKKGKKRFVKEPLITGNSGKSASYNSEGKSLTSEFIRKKLRRSKVIYERYPKLLLSSSSSSSSSSNTSNIPIVEKEPLTLPQGEKSSEKDVAKKTRLLPSCLQASDDEPNRVEELGCF